MKIKDILFIGAVAGLSFLLYKKTKDDKQAKDDKPLVGEKDIDLGTPQVGILPMSPQIPENKIEAPLQELITGAVKAVDLTECQRFQLKTDDKSEDYISYWVDGTTYYAQRIGKIIRHSPIKISKVEYEKACLIYRALKK